MKLYLSRRIAARPAATRRRAKGSCLLFSSVVSALPALAAAQQDLGATPAAAPVTAEPEAVIVEASPFGRSADELVHPVDVIRGDELERRRRGTIGDVLADRPGVSSSSFGPGVGRPIIRGQGGPRVQILDNGIAAMDASSISADHAVGVDPLQAEQIEIIKGPATLIYGGGASAGLVNVVDDRLPDEVTPGMLLSGNASYGSNADERNAALKARYGRGALQWGAQYAWRDAGDFSIPGRALREHEEEHEEEEEPDHQDSGLLENSSLRTTSYGGSLAWIGGRGMLGTALSRLETNYGIPPGAHESEHDGGEQVYEEGGGGVRIDLEQTRVDLRGVLNAPLSGFERLETRVGINDYQHREIEASGETGTRFEVAEQQARVQLRHEPIGQWRGVFGTQLSYRDFEATGEEAFVPPTITRSVGLFAVEERSFGEHRLELGARVDHQEQRPEADAEDRDFTALSLSAGTSFTLAEHLHLRLNAQRAQRTPGGEELYAFGPHIATATFERGNPDLDAETANNFELTLGRDGGRFTWELSGYYNRIADYVYLHEVDRGLNADGSGTAASDGVADRVDEEGLFDPEGELLLADTVQEDAEFYGAEASAGFKLVDAPRYGLTLRVLGDTLRGRLRSGSDLPRMTPARFGGGIDLRYGAATGSLSYLRAQEQTHVAALETETPGYDQLDADLGYTLRAASWKATLYLQGRNLLDEERRLSTSFLKDVAPLPGRSVFAGLRFDFAPPV